jgi:phosphatidylserine/phosphatidylglycerophosphate/cardiolipin synthase-like enzyme
MTPSWEDLSAADLRSLASGVRSGRVPPRPSVMALRDYSTPDVAQWLAGVMATMQADPATLAAFLDLLAKERARVEAAAESVELVVTGPEVAGMQSRDTGAVMRELFSSAQHSVLVAGYAVHRGREVFAALANRMAAVPGLDVRLVVDIPRRHGDTTIDSDLVHRYAVDFQQRNWPGDTMPEVFYDPNSLAMDSAKRSAMHAKIVVIDKQVALITSANFTTAAQQKNIEAGVLLRDCGEPRALHDWFMEMRRTRFRRVVWG